MITRTRYMGQNEGSLIVFYFLMKRKTFFGKILKKSVKRPSHGKDRVVNTTPSPTPLITRNLGQSYIGLLKFWTFGQISDKSKAN